MKKQLWLGCVSALALVALLGWCSYIKGVPNLDSQLTRSVHKLPTWYYGYTSSFVDREPQAPDVSYAMLKSDRGRRDLKTDFASKGSCKQLTKWAVMVVTSAEPTSAARMFLNVTTDWCLLIVGRQERYNHISNRSIYLKPSRKFSLQMTLKTTSWSLFGMINIGYLYAIANGAKVIVDVDNDSIPRSLGGQYFPITDVRQSYSKPVLPDENLAILKSYRGIDHPDAPETLAWNPLPAFGITDVWPRGFPQAHLATSADASGSLVCYPIVQQFITVSGRNYAGTNHKDFMFGAEKKIVVPRGLFAPYNAEATVHLYESFWALLLPRTISESVSDIWRSYIAQSLFYLIPDACLMFTGPAVYHQQINDISVQKLYMERTQFENASQLLQTLKYLPMQFTTVQEALLKVYTRMHDEGFLGQEDLDYAAAWMADLKAIGYTFPLLPDKSRLWTRNIQLCVAFNHAAGEGTVRLLLAYYLRFFNHIMFLFDGNVSETPSFIPDFVQFSGCGPSFPAGFLHNKCLQICLNEPKEGIEGFLYVHDDMYVNLTYLGTLPLSKLWFVPIPIGSRNTVTNKWGRYWHQPVTAPHYKEILRKLPQYWKKQLASAIGPNRVPSHINSDIVYVPNSEYREQMYNILSFINNTTDLHSEISIPLAVVIAAQNKHVRIRMNGLISGGTRLNLGAYHRVINSGAAYIHPMKHSFRPMADLWCQLMAADLRQVNMSMASL